MQNGMPYWWFKSYGGPLEGSRLTADDHAVWRAVPPSRVIGCMHYVAGQVTSDDHGTPVSWLSKWPADKATLSFGEIAHASERPSGGGSVSTLASLFESPELPLDTHCLAPGAIRRAVLEKIKVNASINTLSAMTRMDCGDLTATASSRDALRRICAEVDALAAALDPPLPLQPGGEYILERYGGQHGLLPSMLQDLNAGRPLERVALVTALVALGERLGVATPSLALMDALLEGVESVSSNYKTSMTSDDVRNA